MNGFKYEYPLDIFWLFRNENEIENLFAFLVKEVIKDVGYLRYADKKIMPVVRIGNIGFNIDINYFLSIIAVYINDSKLFDDWKVVGKINDEKSKRLSLFFNAFLEKYLGIVYINKAIRTTDKLNGFIAIGNMTNFYNQMIYKKDDEYVQFNAIVLRENAMNDILINSDEYNEFKSISDTGIEQVAFGKKECDRFWLERENDGLKRKYFTDIL